MILGIIVLTMVTLERLGELWLSNRKTKRLLAQGAHEVGAGVCASVRFPPKADIPTNWVGVTRIPSPSLMIRSQNSGACTA